MDIAGSTTRAVMPEWENQYMYVTTYTYIPHRYVPNNNDRSPFAHVDILEVSLSLNLSSPLAACSREDPSIHVLVKREA